MCIIFLATRARHCCLGWQNEQHGINNGNGTANLETIVTPDLQHSLTPSAYESFLRVGYAFPRRTPNFCNINPWSCRVELGDDEGQQLWW